MKEISFLQNDCVTGRLFTGSAVGQFFNTDKFTQVVHDTIKNAKWVKNVFLLKFTENACNPYF